MSEVKNNRLVASNLWNRKTINGHVIVKCMKDNEILLLIS